MSRRYRGGVKHRDRHGRGIRGALAGPNPLTGSPLPVRYRTRGAEFFTTCIHGSVARISRTCPRALAGVDIGFEDVPTLAATWYDRAPLAAAVSARPGQNGQVVLYRRPLEHRAASRKELATLVHRTIVEQLAALTGIDPAEIDPPGADEDWD